MTHEPPQSRHLAGIIFRCTLLLLFAWLVGRQWHPYYGFTGFLQIDQLMASAGIPAVRDDLIFLHTEPGSYDGGYYAQIATDPSLRDPAFRSAIDDLGYRARRILLSATAWVLSRGDPVQAMRAYAWLNIGLWFGLAALLWRVFPLTGWRGTAAWVAVLFSAGVLFSVRLALTDLAALLLIAGGVVLVERARPTLAALLLGVAGLARETAVLGAAALLPGTGGDRSLRRLGFLATRGALVVAPLLLWLLYVRHAAGGSSAGQQNLSWPFSGWWDRWGEIAGSMNVSGSRRLQWESLLEHVALTVQVAYLAGRPRRECPWWRVGAAYGVLLAGLGGAVWGGFPNATSRVLLPLTLAFNVRLVRDQARWIWFLLGNLSLLAGIHAMQYPAGIAHELPAASTWESWKVLETDTRWSVAEWNSSRRWAWCDQQGGLTFRTWPHRPTIRLELQLRGITARWLEVRHGGELVWRGTIGTGPQWITLPELPTANGRLTLELSSDTPGTPEGENNTARRIGFACYGARIAGE